MEIFTIAGVLIAEVVLIAKTLICYTLLRNCKITEDDIVKSSDRRCNCQLKGSENGSEHSISPDNALKESINKQILVASKTRLAPVKPPRAFRQSRVKQDSREKNENIHSTTLDNIRNRYPDCYCNQHDLKYQKENGHQKITIPTERNSSNFLPINNKLQKQTSFKVGINSSRSTPETPELAKLSSFHVTSSLQIRNSQFNCRSINISRNTRNDETSTRYMEPPTLNYPTRYLQQKIKRNQTYPLTSTKIGSKESPVKNSPLHKLYKYFARIFHQCFDQISKK